jgi:hypothetical protein
MWPLSTAETERKPIMPAPLSRPLLGLLLATLAATPVRADVFVIDGAAGTLYDGIVDGFPLPPPGFPQDGVADLQGNDLAVALQDGVTEERGIIEFPLAALAGLGSAEIATATLTFNIDDVIGTFGPGTAFDGAAADTIILFSYSADGSITLDDFENVAGAPLAVVDTTPHGGITDATLMASGPISFDVDVTAALGALLDGAASHMGIVFATNDDLSATSIDDKGLGAAGPPGVGGAALPILTVETAAEEPPLWSKEQVKCQKALGKGGAKLAKTTYGSLGKCFDGVLGAVSKGQSLANVVARCDADLDPADPDSKVGKAIGKLHDAVEKRCVGLVPVSLDGPCDEAALDLSETADCIAARHSNQVAAMIAAAYADSCALATAAGLETAYPALCGAP